VAVDAFQKEKVDIALMEVGLGGRLDATNVIEPDISVITSVGLDHQDWLGYSIEAIAREKAGIMRPEKPAVFGGLDTPNSVIDHSIRLEAALHRRGKEFDVKEATDSWSWTGRSKTGEKIEYSQLPLPSLIIDNAASAIQALQFLPEPPAIKAISAGMAKAKVPGRYEKRVATNAKGERVELILDVAHNPQAAEKLVENLKKEPVSGKTRALLAMYADKDSAGVIDVLSEVVDEWVVTDFDSPRALKKKALFELLKARDALVKLGEPVGVECPKLLDKAEEGDRLLVTGSFMTVAEAL
jgi:dihydrofolate synthase/folylpolyglutamate synthase